MGWFITRIPHHHVSATRTHLMHTMTCRNMSCFAKPNIHQSKRKKIPKQLERPEVIYSNNHLLVVNKPAGWKSQPGNGGGSSSSSAIDPKCLLTYLKLQSLGGGSNKDFLIPTHRLDQPCSGVLIFAKNGKAASRVQVAWAKRNVKKTYWVVVEGSSQTTSKRNDKMNGLELLIKQSTRTKAKNIYKLSAILKSTKGKNARGNRRSNNNNAGGSVLVKPIPPNYSSLNGENSKDGRICHIEWKHLRALSGERHLLSVSTDTGKSAFVLFCLVLLCVQYEDSVIWLLYLAFIRLCLTAFAPHALIYVTITSLSS